MSQKLATKTWLQEQGTGRNCVQPIHRNTKATPIHGGYVQAPDRFCTSDAGEGMESAPIKYTLQHNTGMQSTVSPHNICYHLKNAKKKHLGQSYCVKISYKKCCGNSSD